MECNAKRTTAKMHRFLSTLEELVRELYREHGDSKNLRNAGNTAQLTRCHYPSAGSLSPFQCMW
jgi:hypothetical protein